MSNSTSQNNKQEGSAMIMVSHDLALAKQTKKCFNLVEGKLQGEN